MLVVQALLNAVAGSSVIGSRRAASGSEPSLRMAMISAGREEIRQLAVAQITLTLIRYLMAMLQRDADRICPWPGGRRNPKPAAAHQAHCHNGVTLTVVLRHCANGECCDAIRLSA
jgi:hypothetical protein